MSDVPEVTPPAWWRRIPIDLIGLLAIVVLILATHPRYVRHGMCFDDPSWLFHFGRRTLQGDVPFRDYIYQVGPLPIYVDAGFQGVFGNTYIASLYASMAITILRVFAVWMIVRRLAGVPAAAAFAVFASLDTTFAVQHHWGTQYSSLFILLNGMWFLLASRSDRRRALVYLALAGASAALIVTARQSSAILIAVLLLATTSILFVRKELTRPRFMAVWAGFVGALVVTAVALALLGALGPAIQQMFIDAPAKKGVHGIASILDAISGGALVPGGDLKWWNGFLIFLGIPSALVAAAVFLSTRERSIEPGTFAMLLVPGVVVLGLSTRYAQLNWFTDLPRMFLSVMSTFAVLSPDRLRRWFGLEPLVAIGLGALPLASDWALEMSFPGRGWGDLPSLITGALLVSLASSRIPQRFKTMLCIVVGMMGVIHFVVLKRARANPFAQLDSSDGSLRENRHRVDHPMLAGLKVHEARKAGLTWLAAQVRPGSSCFIYGNTPVLYSLLGCTNPTRVDTTAGDFITADDAEAASAALLASPPDFLITHEEAWMNPPVTLDLGGKLENYDGLNPRASRAMHMGLRAILHRYEPVGLLGEALGEKFARLASVQRDRINAIRVYRRTR